VDFDVTGFNSGAKVLTELEPVEKVTAHLRGEHLVLGLAHALREVHRKVRVGKQRLGTAGTRHR
jgi:NurA-like 5'-3' nuclease